MSIAKKYPSLFWDVCVADVDDTQFREFVIERVLEHGSLESVHDLLSLYSREEIVDVVRSSRRISRRTAYFWQVYFSIEGPIRCIQRESQNKLSLLWE